MLTSLFFLFNHTPTPSQLDDARRFLGVGCFVEPPPEIQRLWRQVPPESEGIAAYLAPVRDWLGRQAGAGDFVLIQGDFGATYLMVRFAMQKGLVPVYATTERQVAEQTVADGRVHLTHTFAHRRFRRYGD